MEPNTLAVLHWVEGKDIRVVLNGFLYRSGCIILTVTHISYEHALGVHRGVHGYHRLSVELFALDMRISLQIVFEDDLLILVDSYGLKGDIIEVDEVDVQ